MPTIGPDFCMVQLTAAGALFAKGGPMHVSNGRTSLVFMADVTQRVAVYEWITLLRDYHTPTGAVFFELAPAAPAPPPIAMRPRMPEAELAASAPAPQHEAPNAAVEPEAPHPVPVESPATEEEKK